MSYAPRRSRLGYCLAGLIVLAGCRHKEAPSASAPVFDLAVADPALDSRVLRGFYDGDKAWKWTGRIFAVLLDAPPPANETTFLILDFNAPDELMRVVKEVTVTARVNGEFVGSQKYTASGRYLLQLKVPARLLKQSPAELEFELDRAVRVEGMRHEIGLIVMRVQLTHNENPAKGTDSLTVAVR
jgi:hypothetical protein